MLRIDRVSKALQKFTEEQFLMYGYEGRGIIASEVSEYLCLDRANVSKDLNKLVLEKKAVKLVGRPVVYFHKEVVEEKTGVKLIQNSYSSLKEFRNLFNKNINNTDINQNNSFSRLIGSEDSLKEVIKKAKAAIFYPPHGLTTLITGETGVGKSLFVEAMFRYAKKNKKIDEKSQFVVFNCADYADNQQLLLSHLFGHKKGSFTGAEEEKKGLVEIANGGILFLDEVHRLSSKGQEMLFDLMDKGIYKKLGEVEESHKVDVRIVMATTEEPSNVMLNTFLRRIPVHIHIPSLKVKSFKEKFDLLCHFFKKESNRMGCVIRVNQEVLAFLLSYQFTGNIGQMTSDIQYTCANAYLESLSKGKDEIPILVNHLPHDTNLDISEIEDLRSILYSLPESIVFSPKNIQIKQYKKNNLDGEYKEIRGSWTLLAQQDDQLDRIYIIEEMISNYTGKMIRRNDKERRDSKNNVKNLIIDKGILQIVKNILKDKISTDYIEFFTKIISYHLSIVVEDSKKTNNLFVNKNLKEPTKNSLASTITEEIEIQMKKQLYISISKIDKEIIKGIVSYLINNNNSQVGIVVIMHGDNTAKSIAKTVNQLLGIESVDFVNMCLNSRIQDIYQITKDKVKQLDKGSGVLIMADMGSIKMFEKLLIKEIDNKVKVIDMASTPLILEAAKISLSQNVSLDELYDTLVSIMSRHWQSLNDKDINININNYRHFEKIVIQSLEKILVFLDSEKTYTIFKQILDELLDELNLSITDEFLLKFVIHNSCMIERVFTGDTSFYDNSSQVLEINEMLFASIKSSYNKVEDFFGLSISKAELINIMDMFIYEFPSKFGKVTHKNKI